MNKRDKPQDMLYSRVLEEIIDFSFDESVAEVFPDMIQRSVPGYSTIINMVGIFAAQYAKPGSHCYDLGCSLGAATLSMRHRIRHPDCRIIAVDNSAAMAERCRQNITMDYGSLPVQVLCDDISNIGIENASVVVLNFTLQFIPAEQRLQLLSKIAAGMLPGGCLILSEKIACAGEDEEDFLQEMHYAFKRANGYSDLEISQKRSALENVMIPDSLDTHHERLRQAGFSRSWTWFQCFNFASIACFV